MIGAPLKRALSQRDRAAAKLHALEAEIAALRKALVRLLWDSVADDAVCTCCAIDQCAQCEAMTVLGLGRWRGALDAERRLSKVQP